MKRARGVLVFVLVIVLLLSIPGATVFAQETVNDLGPVSSKDVIYQIITDRFYDGDSTNNIPVGFSSNLYDGTGADLKLYQGGDWDGIVQKIPYLLDVHNQDNLLTYHKSHKHFYIPDFER